MSEDKRDIYKVFNVEGARPEGYTREDVEDDLEAVAGDDIIGQLGGNMPDKFVEMTILEFEIEDIAQSMRRRAVHKLADQLAEANGDMQWLLANASKLKLFESEADAELFFEKQGLYAKLHAEFWYNVRTLFACWNSWLEIRHDFYVVSTGKKYSQK